MGEVGGGKTGRIHARWLPFVNKLDNSREERRDGGRRNFLIFFFFFFDGEIIFCFFSRNYMQTWTINCGNHVKKERNNEKRE